MSTHNVKRQIQETKQKIVRAKEQIASLEKTLREMESRVLGQSNSQPQAQQHSV
jgi:hypothetical protein